MILLNCLRKSSSSELIKENKISEILDFWFEGIDSPNQVSGKLTPYWFNATQSLNNEIRSRFFEDIDYAVSNNYDSWMTTAKGSLALIILLDQFTRNMYPNSIEKLKGDNKARFVARHIIDNGLEPQLWPIHLTFVYLPFEHSEDLQDQLYSVEKHKELLRNSPESIKPSIQSSLLYAEIHKNVIETYGRFPGRNYFMGRENTKAEEEYLKNDPYKF